MVGTLSLVPDTTLVRMVDAPSATTAMWRGLLVSLSLGVVLTVRYRRSALRAVVRMGWPGLVSSCLWGSTTLMMVAAVDRTTVANVLVIVAAAPMVAAVLSAVVLRESLARRTWIAIPTAMAGVALAFSAGVEGTSNRGDLLAAGVAVAIGANLTLLRRNRAVDMVPAGFAGGLLAAVVLAAVGTAGTVNGDDILPLIAMGGLSVPAGLALLTLATRHLSSPEVALIVLLETILGPVFAAVAVSEAIPLRTLGGGAVVVATLSLHSLFAMRTRDRVRPAMVAART